MYGHYGLAFHGDGTDIYPDDPQAAAAVDRKAKEFCDFFGLAGPVSLTDITIASPGEIWSVGGFTFTAESYTPPALNGQGGKDFTAHGILSSAGFEDTKGTFEFSSNSTELLASFSASNIATPVPVPAGILLMGTALAGFGVMRRRKQRA